MDVPTIGNTFTWTNVEDNSISRIDKILLTESIINWWSLTEKVIDDKDISDHSLIWVQSNVMNWGSKQFKDYAHFRTSDTEKNTFLRI